MSARKGGLKKGRGLEALIGGALRGLTPENTAETVGDTGADTEDKAGKSTAKPKEDKPKTSAKAKGETKEKADKPKTAAKAKAKAEDKAEKPKTTAKAKAQAEDKPATSKTTAKTKQTDKADKADKAEKPKKADMPDEEIVSVQKTEDPVVEAAATENDWNSQQDNEVIEDNREKKEDSDLPVSETEVRITQIIPNSEQPRREFDEASLEELAESIKIHGVLQPLLVQKKGKYYEIIAGERRWRAAKLVGLKKVPVIVRDYTPRQTLEISLIENIQRQDLNPIDEAFAYKRLLEEFSLTQAEVAKRVSKSRAVITNALRLLKLDERVQRMLVDNLITTGHARALLSIEDGDTQFEIANRIASEALNVRETEKLINSLKKRPVQRKQTDTVQMESIYAPIEEQLKQVLGTKVSLHHKRSGGGTIEIEYYSTEELERIIDILSSSGEDSQ